MSTQLKTVVNTKMKTAPSTTNGKPRPSVMPAKVTHSVAAIQRAARRPDRRRGSSRFVGRGSAPGLHCEHQREHDHQRADDARRQARAPTTD